MNLLGSGPGSEFYAKGVRLLSSLLWWMGKPWGFLWSNTDLTKVFSYFSELQGKQRETGVFNPLLRDASTTSRAGWLVHMPEPKPVSATSLSLLPCPASGLSSTLAAKEIKGPMDAGKPLGVASPSAPLLLSCAPCITFFLLVFLSGTQDHNYSSCFLYLCCEGFQVSYCSFCFFFFIVTQLLHAFII